MVSEKEQFGVFRADNNPAKWEVNGLYTIANGFDNSVVQTAVQITVKIIDIDDFFQDPRYLSDNQAIEEGPNVIHLAPFGAHADGIYKHAHHCIGRSMNHSTVVIITHSVTPTFAHFTPA